MRKKWKNTLSAYAGNVWKNCPVISIAAYMLSAALLILHGHGIGAVILGSVLSGVFAAAVTMTISLGIQFAIGENIQKTRDTP